MNRSLIFKTAWHYLKQNLFTSFSEALKAAWSRFKIIAKLQDGIAYFSYKNSNGETREAIGTLRTGNFRYIYKTNESRDTKLDIVTYWDLVSKGFRAFRIERLMTA